MTEKVTIQSCINKTAKDGNPYQSIVLADGRKCTAWKSDFSPYLNKVVDVEVSQSGNFMNVELPQAVAPPQQPDSNVTTQQPAATTIQASQEAVVNNLVKAIVDLINLYKK